MRHNKAIALLSTAYATVTAPKEASASWTAWSRGACEVVADNLSDCGGNFISDAIHKSWDYDPYKKEFYFTIEYPIDGDVSGESIVGHLTRTFVLNPVTSLSDEIERLRAALQSWIAAARYFVRQE